MWLYKVSSVMLRPLAAPYFPIQLVGNGQESSIPDPPFIVATNHASFLDPWFIGGALTTAPLSFLINERWYNMSRAWTAFFRAYGVTPTCDGNLAGTVRKCVESLEAGRALAVFPEGRISYDGRMNQTRLGVGWMAAFSGVPVIPCGLRGNFEALPRHRRIPRRHAVEVHLGSPLRFAPTSVPSPHPEQIYAFVSRVSEQICRLAGQEDRIDIARPAWPPRDLGSSVRGKVGTKLANSTGKRLPAKS